MSTLESTTVWNRAALDLGGAEARAGDRALADLLLLHGMVMNGGVGHVPETLTSDQIEAALAGFRFFGMVAVADLLVGVQFARDEDFERLDILYGQLVPSDSTISDAFELRFMSSPDAFAPVTPEEAG